MGDCDQLPATLTSRTAFEACVCSRRRLFPCGAPGSGGCLPGGSVSTERAEWLAPDDRSDEAEPKLCESREIFTRLGATRWLERTDAVKVEPRAEAVAPSA